jgi:hypothetical protein
MIFYREGFGRLKDNLAQEKRSPPDTRLRQLLPAQLSLSSRRPSTWTRRRAKRSGPCRKPDSALSRLMGIRVFGQVG